MVRRHIYCLWMLALVGAGLTVPARPAEAALISTRDEIEMGRDAAHQLEAKYRTYRDPRVEEIGRAIVQMSDRRDVPYTFKVIDRSEVNALSLPGGPVYVFRGLLQMVGNDDDALAGVIAHEVGHIEKRHAVKQVEKAMGANLLLELFTRGNTRTAGAIIANLLSLKYSRNDEYQADERAVITMSRAGFDPHGLVRFFQRLQQQEGRDPSKVQQWLSTHPASSDRIRRVQRLIGEMSVRRVQ
jgi:beta-barrel assembly-enhancing protease